MKKELKEVLKRCDEIMNECGIKEFTLDDSKVSLCRKSYKTSKSYTREFLANNIKNFCERKVKGVDASEMSTMITNHLVRSKEETTELKSRVVVRGELMKARDVVEVDGAKDDDAKVEAEMENVDDERTQKMLDMIC